jgi:hypothetical protein
MENKIMRNITASQALQVLLEKVNAEGIDSLQNALQFTVTSEHDAEIAMQVADAISDRNDAVQDAQQLNGKVVVVQLGNYGDSQGAALAKGQVLSAMFNMGGGVTYLVATPKGVAAATPVRGGGNMYSTHCMPVPEYSGWILQNWGLDITDHEDALNESTLLGDNITDDRVMMKLIKEALEDFLYEG